MSKQKASQLKFSPSMVSNYGALSGLRMIRIAILIGLSLLTLPAAAQNIQYTQNTVDSSLRGEGRVDPSTQGMSIQIPLRAYPGRAGASLPITLHYSSKVWRLKFTSTIY